MANKQSKGGSNVSSGSGSKSGKKDTGSVGDMNTSAKVTHNETSHDVTFAKGGSTHMFGEQVAGERTGSDKSPSTGKPDSSGPGAEFAKGGSGKMFGFAGSMPARDGITSAR
jgi:hypothetical protein